MNAKHFSWKIKDIQYNELDKGYKHGWEWGDGSIECVNECMNEWMNKWMNEWMNECMNE